jgi:uncharacterized protein YbjT (DUF2867 family)
LIHAVKYKGEMKPKVAIAGCAGFLGQRLAKQLSTQYQVVGLGRSHRPPPALVPVLTEWRQVDLFSQSQAEAALRGVEYCYYLVHSMLPRDRLAQGRFEDFDYLAADNFAQAAARNGVRQIIYMGGLIPEANHELSRHLESRREVEKVLASRNVPLTTLRAGLIVGSEGSSFLILVRLVKRLPAMVCPQWTQSLTQPIDVDDALALLEFCLGKRETFGQTFDIGGPDILSYRDMIATTAEILGKKRFLFSVPFFSPKLSRLWVTLTTGTPRALVYPLVESLRHQMTAADDRLVQMAGLRPLPFRQSVQRALAQTQSTGLAAVAHKPTPAKKQRLVRSVQRFGCPSEWTALELARRYFAWLPGHMWGIVGCRSTSEGCVFSFRFPEIVLLELKLERGGSIKATADKPLDANSDERTKDSAVMTIVGGLLACNPPSGRLEFRRLGGSNEAISAVHDYEPRLPWWVYKVTQSPLHVWVMRAFGRYAEKSARREVETLGVQT